MILKFEARNPNFETNSNDPSTEFKTGKDCFENLNLGFVSNWSEADASLDIRIFGSSYRELG